jgi:hypothetical protein
MCVRRRSCPPSESLLSAEPGEGLGGRLHAQLVTQPELAARLDTVRVELEQKQLDAIRAEVVAQLGQATQANIHQVGIGAGV